MLEARRGGGLTMEEGMVEENGNEEECTFFTAYEIDLDYEYDAVRFFDFCRPESHLEASQAEVWFNFAGSYPPSPFVEKLTHRGLMENISISPKSKGVENLSLPVSDSDIEMNICDAWPEDMNYKDVEERKKEITTPVQTGSRKKFNDSSKSIPSKLNIGKHARKDLKSKVQTKLSGKPSFQRTSTLMNPTASLLAKQNRSPKTGYLSGRSISSATEKISISSGSTCRIENQASKRQKLEGGLLRKIVDPVQPQQPWFFHKAPKRDIFENGTTTQTKPRITIPREPDLETAHRALRTRPKSSKEVENVAATVRGFKARPLNRKILEACSLLPKRNIPRTPDFQEFHLKTSERAMQHNSTVPHSTNLCHNSDITSHKQNSSTTTERGDKESERPSHLNVLKPEVCEPSRGFKAIPFNRKILTSKGTLGVFRNSKKETTVPTEFKFQMEKRLNFNPPTDLFNKLSLASETQPMTKHESKQSRVINCQSAKGSKENRWSRFQQGNEIKEQSQLEVVNCLGESSNIVRTRKTETLPTASIS